MSEISRSLEKTIARLALAGKWPGRCLLTFQAHSAQVVSLAFCPEGERVLSQGADDTCHLWKLTTAHHGTTARKEETYGGSAVELAIGLRDLGASDNCSQSSTCGDPPTISDGPFDCAAVSSDGLWGLSVAQASNTLTWTTRRTFRLWDLSTQIRLCEFQWVTDSSVHLDTAGVGPHGEWVWCITSVMEPELRLWNVNTGECLGPLRGECLAISSDGRYMMLAKNAELDLWDLQLRKHLRGLYGHTGCIESVAISPDNEWALSGSTDGNICLWNLPSGYRMAKLEAHSGGVSAVAISSDRRFGLSGGKDGTVRLWELPCGFIE